METAILDKYRQMAEGAEAEAILRACVHCGFCTATCPTYQLLGDERDGPRGRIYLIKQLLEGREVTARTLTHLDRCLSCRSCEITCPSGVHYARLADIGRALLRDEVGYSAIETVKRWLIQKIVPYPGRMRTLIGFARGIAPFLPKSLASKIPRKHQTMPWAVTTHPRRYLVLQGCVQEAVTPEVNAAASQVLARLGIALETAPEGGCCGALSHHESNRSLAREQMHRNIDAWWPWLQQGGEGILVSASGCGLMVKEYGKLLQNDPEYAEKAATISAHTLDIAELLVREPLEQLPVQGEGMKIAFHPPCSLQHGQQINGVVEGILQRFGFDLVPFNDSHLCCGSAGTFSLLQPGISSELQRNKLTAIAVAEPEAIVTANIGCELHLAAGSDLPVMHWINLVAERLPSTRG